MNKKAFAILVMAGLFSTAGALAQEKENTKVIGKSQTIQQGQKVDMFDRTDADKDGKISKAEADNSKSKLKDKFADIDTNKDNFIDKDEMKAYRQNKKAMVKQNQLKKE